jgi:hypothetical protein
MPANVYFGNLLRSLTVQDIFISVVKSIVFGMIISMTAIIQGFAVLQSSTEIPVAGLRGWGLPSPCVSGWIYFYPPCTISYSTWTRL